MLVQSSFEILNTVYLCLSFELLPMKSENTPIQSIIVQDFDYKDLELLEKYKGNPLLIIIYNNQCLGCTGRAIPLAYEFQQEYDILQVIGIIPFSIKNKSQRKILKAFSQKNEIPFPYLFRSRAQGL